MSMSLACNEACHQRSAWDQQHGGLRLKAVSVIIGRTHGHVSINGSRNFDLSSIFHIFHISFFSFQRMILASVDFSISELHHTHLIGLSHRFLFSP
ncbi:hypothetical protein CEXT_55631 [Caerostris extrusa]|uniref:Uncharacterized protein n=1 Tax=Caerostris extrusa TaxID=172846 RepID=A0AAV4NA13_CAEEX|nr:hypothetical protein CEXT_55631 [Caerostris extrusa]